MKLEELKQYDKIANKFSLLHSKLDKVTNAAYYPRLMTEIKGKKLLDLGCGDGIDLYNFQAAGAKVSGVDISKEMVELAKKRLPKAELLVAHNEKIPFKDNAFDIVTSKYVFQTSKNLDPIYKQVQRVLKRKGIFCFVAVHPVRQFMEKKKNNKDYFKKELVHSVLFGGKLTVHEPSHTVLEYLSPYFLLHFDLIDYDEKFDPSNAEKVEGAKYPAFLLIKARKR